MSSETDVRRILPVRPHAELPEIKSEAEEELSQILLAEVNLEFGSSSQEQRVGSVREHQEKRKIQEQSFAGTVTILEYEVQSPTRKIFYTLVPPEIFCTLVPPERPGLQHFTSPWVEADRNESLLSIAQRLSQVSEVILHTRRITVISVKG